MSITVKRLSSLSDYETATRVQQLSWGFSDLEILPAHFMRAYESCGEQLAAFHGGEMVGLALAYPTDRPHSFLLHMMCTLPNYRNRGIGKELLARLDISLRDRGGKNLFWTYDPLVKANSQLYLNHFNAIGYEVQLDYYGRIHSTEHGSLPTHRLLCFKRLAEDLKLSHAVVPSESLVFEGRLQNRDHFFSDLQHQLRQGLVVTGSETRGGTTMSFTLSRASDALLDMITQHTC